MLCALFSSCPLRLISGANSLNYHYEEVVVVASTCVGRAPSSSGVKETGIGVSQILVSRLRAKLHTT